MKQAAPAQGEASGRLSGDSGFTAVMVGLLAVVILAFSAIAIDGGQAYAQRRVTQNAADAAAMAGTRAVDQVRFDGAPVARVYDSVTRALGENDADEYECYLIANDQALTRDTSVGNFCAAGGLPPALDLVTHTFNTPEGPMHAAGVEVNAEQTKDTFFAGVVGFDETTARATASATIQPYVGGSGSPFILCGLPTVNADSYDILNADLTWSATAAAGTWDYPNPSDEFPLQAAQQPSCGAGSAFKGKNNSDEIAIGVPCPAQDPPYPYPCENAWGDNGNGFSDEIRDVVVGSTPCESDGTDITNAPCDILVPVASNGGSNGNKIWMKIVAWVVVHVECKQNAGEPHDSSRCGKGNPKYYGSLVRDGGVMTSGLGAWGDVTENGTGTRVIKLVQ